MLEGRSPRIAFRQRGRGFHSSQELARRGHDGGEIVLRVSERHLVVAVVAVVVRGGEERGRLWYRTILHRTCSFGGADTTVPFWWSVVGCRVSQSGNTKVKWSE
jgi:hypothetical protein